MSLLQMAGGVAVAGVVAAGATAVTGSGVTLSGTATNQWVGGTATQTVTGASVTAIAYTYADPAKTQVSSIDITISGAPSKTVTITPGGGTLSTSPLANEWTCSGTNSVSAVSDPSAPAVTMPSGGASVLTCAPSDSGNSHATAGRYYSGLSTLAINAA